MSVNEKMVALSTLGWRMAEWNFTPDMLSPSFDEFVNHSDEDRRLMILGMCMQMKEDWKFTNDEIASKLEYYNI